MISVAHVKLGGKAKGVKLILTTVFQIHAVMHTSALILLPTLNAYAMKDFQVKDVTSISMNVLAHHAFIKVAVKISYRVSYAIVPKDFPENYVK